MYMPPRGGTRGGKDQFEWEDVKVDKHRENYLGHSLMAPVGRWQKGKDLTWYNKKSSVAGRKERLKAEVAAVKRAEEEAMAAALGLKPSVQPQTSLSRQEIAEAFRRKSVEEREEGGEERMKGLGYQSQRSAMLYTSRESITTKEGATIFEHDPDGRKDHSRVQMMGTSSHTLSPEPPPAKRARPEMREEAWVEREDSHPKRSKEKKKSKEKKAKKKHKKEKRRHRHDSDSEEEKSRQRRKEPRSSKRRRHDTSSGSD